MVATTMPSGDITRVGDDEQDFYGRRYWFEHQAALAQDDLEQRSRNDLHERCLYWLRALLRYHQPPGRVLELGCAHGGFVHLLRLAGFDATGLELSPWVVAFARRTFDIPMLLGPLEDQSIESGTLDLVVAMDVVEHLPDPMRTLGRAAELLADDGVLVIQTPCRPPARGYDDLVAQQHRFLEMLLPAEHLHLFTEQALRDLLARHGLTCTRFEPALFSHYDMMAFASRRPLTPTSSSAVIQALREGAVQGRHLAALLELFQSLEASQRDFAQADTDRVARQVQIDALVRHDSELEERLARLHAGEELAREQARNARLQDERNAVRHERDGLRASRQALQGEHDAVREAHSALRDEHIALLSAHDALRNSHRGLRAQHVDLELRWQEGEQQRAQDQRVLARLQAETERLHQQGHASEERSRAREVLHTNAVAAFSAVAQAHGKAIEERDRSRADQRQHDARATSLRALVAEYRSGRIYRAMVQSGRWRSFDQRLRTALDEPAPVAQVETHFWSLTDASADPADHTHGVLAIDLTAIRPEGENGGAALVSWALAEALIRQQPKRSWLLLTTEENHYLFAGLEAPNARRHRIAPVPSALAEVRAEMAIDLLFCPMTSPPFRDPSVPLVSVVYDLQYLSYPLFFEADERRERDRHFRRAVADSERMITISEYVRRTVLDHTELAGERVVTALIGLSKRLSTSDAWSDDRVDAMLTARGLNRGRYLFYPANMWPHKNHRMLLVALGMARHRRPDLDLRLVLTCADRPDPAPLVAAAEAMGLGPSVVFAGYVSEAELDGLYRGCRALVFPSLYEGFGMPLLEAMARDRPVLCSDVTALPEVAGDAALPFDPRVPDALATAMVRICTDDALVADLVARGRRRVRALGDTDGMAATCWQVIADVLSNPPELVAALVGVHGDAWAGKRFSVTFGPGAAGRRLRCAVVSPYGVAGAARIELRGTGGRHQRLTLYRHRPLVLEVTLPTTCGRIDFAVETSFQPRELGLGDDPRPLAVKVEYCWLEAGDGSRLDLLAGALDQHEA